MEPQPNDQTQSKPIPNDQIEPVPGWVQEDYGSSALIVWAALLTNKRTKKEPGILLELALEAWKNDGTLPIEKRTRGRPPKDWRNAEWNGIPLNKLALEVAIARPPGQRTRPPSERSRIHFVLRQHYPELKSASNKPALLKKSQSLKDVLLSYNQRQAHREKTDEANKKERQELAKKSSG